MLRFALKVGSASYVRFTPDNYGIKSYKRNGKISNYYVWELRQTYVMKITLELR